MTRTSRSASATLSLADYRVIEGPGHFVHLEKPRELNAAILEFLEKNGLLRG